MEAMNTFHAIQDQIDDLVDGKKLREKKACEKRLEQMEARREKEMKKLHDSFNKKETSNEVGN